MVELKVSSSSRFTSANGGANIISRQPINAGDLQFYRNSPFKASTRNFSTTKAGGDQDDTNYSLHGIDGAIAVLSSEKSTARDVRKALEELSKSTSSLNLDALNELIPKVVDVMKWHKDNKAIQKNGMHLLGHVAHGGKSDDCERRKKGSLVMAKSGAMQLTVDAMKKFHDDENFLTEGLCFLSYIWPLLARCDDQDKLLRSLEKDVAPLAAPFLASKSCDNMVKSFAGSLFWRMSGTEEGCQRIVDAGGVDVICRALLKRDKDEKMNFYLSEILNRMLQNFSTETSNIDVHDDNYPAGRWVREEKDAPVLHGSLASHMCNSDCVAMAEDYAFEIFWTMSITGKGRQQIIDAGGVDAICHALIREDLSKKDKGFALALVRRILPDFSEDARIINNVHDCNYPGIEQCVSLLPDQNLDEVCRRDEESTVEDHIAGLASDNDVSWALGELVYYCRYFPYDPSFGKTLNEELFHGLIPKVASCMRRHEDDAFIQRLAMTLLKYISEHVVEPFDYDRRPIPGIFWNQVALHGLIPKVVDVIKQDKDSTTIQASSMDLLKAKFEHKAEYKVSSVIAKSGALQFAVDEIKNFPESKVEKWDLGGLPNGVAQGTLLLSACSWTEIEKYNEANGEEVAAGLVRLLQSQHLFEFWNYDEVRDYRNEVAEKMERVGNAALMILDGMSETKEGRQHMINAGVVDAIVVWGLVEEYLTEEKKDALADLLRSVIPEAFKKR